MDTVYERMNDDTEVSEEMPDITKEGTIRKFYAGKTIFLTGCTGFVGKGLMEKLLRKCTEIGKIYTLVRPKKQKSITERMDSYFESTFFDKVRQAHPNFRQKVVPICGDLLQPDLGLSAKDRRSITENVDLIIHNAAVVYFEERISMLCQVNVLATQKMLELAEDCPKLLAFLYVSTAYSHCHEEYIEEIFYPPPGDIKMVMDIVRADTENAAGLSQTVIKQLLGEKYPNVYVFTKAIAESLIEYHGKRSAYPCAVFRPSLVTSTLKEPYVSWFGNANGPTFVYTAVLLGLIHTFKLKKNCIVDCIPVDMTVNALIATTWDLATHKAPKTPYMYNFGSSVLNPFHTSDMQVYVESDEIRTPSIKAVWRHAVFLTESTVLFYFLHVLFHMLPALFYDLFLIVQAKKPIVTKEIWKLNRWLPILLKFSNINWMVKADMIMEVHARMSHTDHQDFDFDLRKIEWMPYLETYWNGIRVNILKDPMETVPAAIEKAKKLKLIHNSTVALIQLIGLYCLYKLACYVFNF